MEEKTDHHQPQRGCLCNNYTEMMKYLRCKIEDLGLINY